MDIVKGNIGNALHDVSPNHVVTTADEIYDQTQEQYQDILNREILDSVASGDENTSYATCGTASGTVAKVINDLHDFKLSTNIRLLVKMTNINTATNPTLNINGTGAKGIEYNGSLASGSNSWSAGEVLDVYYDGTKYITNTHGGARFSTGEKVGDVAIEDYPVENSDNLVKSGSLFDLVSHQVYLDTDSQVNPDPGFVPENDSVHVHGVQIISTSDKKQIRANLGLGSGGDESTAFVTCDTAASSVAKVINDLNDFVLSTNIRLLIKMTYTNTATNPTLNINSTGAKSIVYNGSPVSTTNVWEAGEVLDTYYNGTSYICDTRGGG